MCVYVYKHTLCSCIYVYIYTYMYTYLYTRNTYIHRYIGICIYVYVCIQIYTWMVYTFILYICICIWMNLVYTNIAYTSSFASHLVRRNGLESRGLSKLFILLSYFYRPFKLENSSPFKCSFQIYLKWPNILGCQNYPYIFFYLFTKI